MPRKKQAALQASQGATPVPTPERRGRPKGYSPKANAQMRSPIAATESPKQLCVRIDQALGALFTELTNNTSETIPVLKQQLPIYRGVWDSLEGLTEQFGKQKAMAASQ